MRSHSRPNTTATIPTRLGTRLLRTGVVALAAFSLAACATPAGSVGTAEEPAAEAVSFDSISVIAPADPGGGVGGREDAVEHADG